MKLLLTSALVILVVVVSMSQDSSLPLGESWISFHSGKSIGPVQLRHVDSLKIEYVMSGNLDDVRISDIRKIKTPEYVILINSGNKIVIKQYDLIFLVTEDTIRCFIQSIDDKIILYEPVDSDVVKKVKTKLVAAVEVNNDTEDRINLTSVENPNKVSEASPENPIVLDQELNEKSQKIEEKTGDSNTIMTQDSHNEDSDELAVLIGKQSELISRNDSYFENPDPVIMQPEITATHKNSADQNSKFKLMKASYYYMSYQQGENNAKYDYNGAWGLGGFLLGLTFGSPFLTLGASTSNLACISIPNGVDEALYCNGYENQILKMRTQSAARGAAAAKGILIIIFVIALASI